MFKKAYFLLVLLITIPFCVYAVSQANATRDRLVREKTLALYSVVAGLNRCLPVSWAAVDKLVAGDEPSVEKRQLLYDEFEPALRSYAEAWPGYSFGIYLRDLNIVALIPDEPALLGTEATSEALRVYTSGLTEVGVIDGGSTYGGQSILAINQPILHKGQLIGHLWANVKVADIDATIKSELLRSLSTLIILWLLLLIGVIYIMRDIETSLTGLIEAIRRDSGDISRFRDFPQALPLLDTVESLRQQLTADYADRERVAADLAKIDRMNLIGEMAAGLAHEIRNPMTVIRGYLQRMLLKAEGNLASQYALILAETSRINEIITAFLSLAKNRRVEMGRCNLTDLIFQLFPLIQADARKAGAVVNLQPLPEKLLIFADEKEIKQLVLNLVRNAMEAIVGKGTVVITAAEQRNRIVLSVADDGCGIAPELRDKIFDPFYTTKDSGTGLGLAICKSIIDRHGGTIDINSEPGKGTVFTVFLPAAGDVGLEDLAS